MFIDICCLFYSNNNRLIADIYSYDIFEIGFVKNFIQGLVPTIRWNPKYKHRLVHFHIDNIKSEISSKLQKYHKIIDQPLNDEFIREYDGELSTKTRRLIRYLLLSRKKYYSDDLFVYSDISDSESKNSKTVLEIISDDNDPVVRRINEQEKAYQLKNKKKSNETSNSVLAVDVPFDFVFPKYDLYFHNNLGESNKNVKKLDRTITKTTDVESNKILYGEDDNNNKKNPVDNSNTLDAEKKKNIDLLLQSGFIRNESYWVVDDMVILKEPFCLAYGDYITNRELLSSDGSVNPRNSRINFNTYIKTISRIRDLKLID